jgi:hypothetical protein
MWERMDLGPPPDSRLWVEDWNQELIQLEDANLPWGPPRAQVLITPEVVPLPLSVAQRYAHAAMVRPKVLANMHYRRLWLERFERHPERFGSLAKEHPDYPRGTINYLRRFEQWFRRTQNVPGPPGGPSLYGLLWHFGRFLHAELPEDALVRKLLEVPHVVDDQTSGL